MKRAECGRGKFYSRDSGGKHVMTPGQYVEWASRRAAELGVAFSGTAAQIQRMIKEGRPVESDVFFDYCVQGNELSRPALEALLAEVKSDRSVSHVFIPRRDRLARPDDPLDAVMLENSLRKDGITVVFMQGIATPLPRGHRQDIGDLITQALEYHSAGKERTDLSRKMVEAQIALAKQGYSTGGRPPFGFRRYLVRVDGTVMRQLEKGEVVRLAGHHVVWLPGPEIELRLIRRILSMLKTMPATAVARQLNFEQIPSPDAGRTRKDNGIRHEVSGKWHSTTITNIARNKLLVAVVEWGRRSMGDQSRVSPSGPRNLGDADFRQDGKPKVIRNPTSTVIRATGQFDGVVSDKEHDALLQELDRRAGSQRGRARSRSPDKNPLGGRVFDIACGWPMYRVPYAGSYRYKCGHYQQTHGQECNHNHVDGPVAARFLLNCIRQRFGGPTMLARLEAKLHKLASEHAAAMPQNSSQTGIDDLKQELSDVLVDLEAVQKNMARAKNDQQFDAVSKEFDDLSQRKTELESRITGMAVSPSPRIDADHEVEAALKVLSHLERLVDGEHAVQAKNLLELLNARLFLSFRPTQVKRRTLNRLQMAVVTMGDAPPPVKLYAGPTGRRGLKKSAANVAAVTGETFSPGPPAGGEAIPLGNVNRGDRI